MAEYSKLLLCCPKCLRPYDIMFWVLSEEALFGIPQPTCDCNLSPISAEKVYQELYE